MFSAGVSASFYCSFITQNQQWANVSGTGGYVEVPDFVLPFAGETLELRVNNHVFSANGCDFKMEGNVRRVVVPEHSNSHATAQESNLFRNFAEQIRSGQLNELWPEMALKTQQVMCACLDSAREEGKAQ